MRLKHFIFSLITGFLLIATSVSAQVSLDNLQNVKVNQLSDQQIQQILQQFQASGMSEEDGLRLLNQKGMSAIEVDALKKRLEVAKMGSAPTPVKPVAKRDSLISRRDTIKPINPSAVKKASPIYGYDFFTNSDLKFEPNLRIATPKSYVLGPDDEVIIILSGLNEATIKTKINTDGNVQVPYAGPVYLNGFTIEQANGILKGKMQKVYPGLSSGQTKLDINLGNVRSIRITVIGEVTKPGSYTISSLSTFFNALYLSGGPSSRGSLRNIEILRNNKILKTVDFYSFLQKGTLEGNIRLEDQDVVRFPVYTKRIAIDGEIKRPGLYELKDAETLEDLINYAGGFSDNAYRAMAKVVQIGDKERNVRDVPMGLYDRFVPKNADSVYFDAILNRFSNRVVVQGAVYRPGVFELTPDLTLKQLITKADGIREDAFLAKGYIKRTKSDLEKEMVSFDLNKIMSGSSPDIRLIKEDSVMIFSNQDLKDQLSITIDGFVRAPGIFTYRKGMDIADLITMAGGFTNDAATHRVEISRLIKNLTDTVANQLLTTLSIDVDSTLQNGSFALQPLDYIHVPRLVNYHALGNISIKGEVLFPGDYALQRRDENALELISRAGGLTPQGSLPDVKIFRNGIRVDVDLSGERTRQSSKALVLFPGDSIFVPRDIPFVEVVGAVNNPQLINFTSKRFKYYINAAGGLKQNGLLKRAYIQYPNGTNQPVRKFLFFKNYPVVKPGSKIQVPEKAKFPIRLGFGEIGALTSALTALISLIAVLSR